MNRTKVRVFPISVSLSTNVSVGYFYQALQELSRQNEVKAYGRSHIIRCRVVNGYICITVLKVSGDKKSMISRLDKNGRHQVVTSVLKKGDNGVEVIMLAINPESGFGVMYNYWKSTSPGMMADVLSKANKRARSWLAAPYARELKERIKNKEKIHDEILKKYPYDFEMKMVSKRYDTADILKLIDSFKKVIVRSEVLPLSEGEYSPNISALRPRMIEYKVGPEKRRGPIVEAIIRVVSQFMSSDSSVEIGVDGLGFEGEMMHLRIGENRIALDEIDYDDYVGLLPKRYWENFYRSDAIRHLLRICNKHSALFGVPGDPAKWRLKSRERSIELDIE